MFFNMKDPSCGIRFDRDLWQTAKDSVRMQNTTKPKRLVAASVLTLKCKTLDSPPCDNAVVTERPTFHASVLPCFYATMRLCVYTYVILRVYDSMRLCVYASMLLCCCDSMIV